MKVTPETFRQFREVLNRVLTSPRSNFYLDKYRRAGFDLERDLKAPADIVRVPRLEKSEVAAVPPDERLYSELSEVQIVRFTSGTTSGQPLVAFRSPPLEPSIPGLRPMVIGYSTDLALQYAYYPRVAPPPRFPLLMLGAATHPAIAVPLMRLCRVDAIIAPPTRIIELAGVMADAERASVRALVASAEMVTADQIATLHRMFPAADIGFFYALSEVGIVGYQCEELKRASSTRYHAYPHFLFEITDPETGCWMPPVSEGEILITELLETPHQFIRYRTGDAGRVVSADPCPCGAAFTFAVVGRMGEDVVKIAGAIIRSDEIGRVLGEFGQWLEPDFRALVHPTGADGAKPAFILQLIPKDPSARHPAHIETLRQELARRMFLTPTQTLADFLSAGRIGRFELELVDAFPSAQRAQRLRVASSDATPY